MNYDTDVMMAQDDSVAAAVAGDSGCAVNSDCEGNYGYADCYSTDAGSSFDAGVNSVGVMLGDVAVENWVDADWVVYVQTAADVVARAAYHWDCFGFGCRFRMALTFGRLR